MRARLHIISRYKEFANTFSDPCRIPNASVKEIHRQTTSRIMKSRCFNQPCTLFLYIYFPQSYFSCADYPINELLSPQNPYFFLCDNPVFILFLVCLNRQYTNDSELNYRCKLKYSDVLIFLIKPHTFS